VQQHQQRQRIVHCEGHVGGNQTRLSRALHAHMRAL
jgi:hypothetical protein